MKKDTLKLFVLTINDHVETEVHLFSNWSAVVKFVSKNAKVDFDTVKECLDETNAYVDEVTNKSYNVTIQEVED